MTLPESATIDNPRLLVRGGQAGIMIAGNIIGNKPQGCPRVAVLRSHGIQEPIDFNTALVFASGRTFEDTFQKYHPDFKVNVRQEEMPWLNERVRLAIEIDAIAPDGTYYEHKTVQSSSKLKPYLITGEYSLDNLIQLCYAMACFGQKRGILRYTAMIFHSCTVNKVECKFRPGMHRDYVVEEIDGRFHVDGKPTVVTVSGVHRHAEYIAFVLDQMPQPYVMPKPMDPEKHENVACHYCYWKTVCQDADVCKMEALEFLHTAKAFTESNNV